MYAGRIVEDLPAAELATPRAHPYTRALLAAVPDMDTDLDAPLATIPGRAGRPVAGCPPAAPSRRAARSPTTTAAQSTPTRRGCRRPRVACWHAGEPCLGTRSRRRDVEDVADVEEVTA